MYTPALDDKRSMSDIHQKQRVADQRVAGHDNQEQVGGACETSHHNRSKERWAGTGGTVPLG